VVVDTAAATAAAGKIAGNPVDKRLAKRHKRQVSRAREKVRLSEPDLRTPEQIAAARLASRPDLRRGKGPWPSLPSDSALQANPAHLSKST
jgi:hypothetical protein